MDYIMACMILDRYMETLSAPRDQAQIIFNENSLKDSKTDIVNAYKIFVAHMLLFKTRTQEEYELLKSSIIYLNMFFSDEFVREFYRVASVRNIKTNMFTPSSKRQEIEMANRRFNEMMQTIGHQLKQPYEEGNWSDTFDAQLFPLAQYYFDAAKRIASTQSLSHNERFLQLLDTYEDYCNDVYQIIQGKRPTEQQVILFLPISVLKNAVNSNSLPVSNEYKHYILYKLPDAEL